MEKRGQAAMEFLMTYGWAILAAVIAIGVLIYFGVFSPGRFVPETCVLAAPLGCDDDSTATVAAGVTLIVDNGGGEDYTVTEVDVSNCATLGPISVTVPSGESATFVVACVPALTLDERFRGNIGITYNKVGAVRDLTSTGSITRKVIA
jgi:hypothetical protein